MIKGIIVQLRLNQVGVLELIFAFYIILSGYTYGILHFDLLVLLIMDIIAFFRVRHRNMFKPMLWLAIFIIVHEVLLWLSLPEMPIYLFNTIVAYLIIFISIYMIAPAINFRKLIGSLNWAALLSMGGIIYHFIIIRTGGIISPIKMPFLPDLPSDTRLYAMMSRPCSFYWEPASFVIFMLVPLFLSLYEKKYFWTLAIAFCMFLSTSSTGIITSLGMIMIYLFTQHLKLRYKILLFSLAFGLGYFLLHSSLFEAGVNKIMSTDIERTSRLINGPMLIANMPLKHFISGIPAANVFDYYCAGYVPDAKLIIKNDMIFVSTFWHILAKFGVCGLILYLNLYIQTIRRSRQLIPYVVVLIILLFSQGELISAVFAFEFIFMIAFIGNYAKRNIVCN